MTAKTDIKYILVETVLDNKDKPIIELIKTSKIGLFKGLRDEIINDDGVPSSFVLLKGKDDELLSLNFDYYNVLSIEKFNGLSKTITYFRSNDEDQNAAIEILKEVTKGMKAGGGMLDADSNMIDTSNYEQVPATFKSAEHSKITVHSSAKSSVSTHRPLQSGHNTAKPPPAKTMTVIKRASKKPSRTALEEMEKKIKQIQAGKFKAKLPKIAGDPPDSELEALDDDYSAQYLMGG